MNYQPVPPSRRHAPQYVGPDTWLIRQVQESNGAPLSVYINSLIITGTEPVIVDTGSAANRRYWLEDAFGIVDPADVRWVFLSHDDADHTGNLAEVMTRCPTPYWYATGLWSNVLQRVRLPAQALLLG